MSEALETIYRCQIDVIDATVDVIDTVIGGRCIGQLVSGWPVESLWLDFMMCGGWRLLALL